VLFNSFIFWIFFPIVFAIYAVLGHRWQNRALLVASYVFYGWWDPRFLTLILLSTVVDYFAGQKLESCEPGSRKRWLLLSLVTNLGVLAAFKYFGFFSESARALLELLGLTVQAWELEIVLPVGISFYTFQTLSYTVGVYREKLKASRSFVQFALFVAFFPQLVAGPIERAETLLPQIEKPRKMSWDGWSGGTLLVALGMFKKVAVADSLAPLVEQTFADPTHHSAASLMVGLYCFSF
jgi:D-alanyl-lipoteichoic acid acyltransferase DltB (MBOAT superfamily)